MWLPIIGHIITGWGKRFGFIQIGKAEQKLCELRLKICGACKYSQQRKLLRMINGTMVNNAELQCTLCHCPCYEKGLVTDEKCPVNKW